MPQIKSFRTWLNNILRDHSITIVSAHKGIITHDKFITMMYDQYMLPETVDAYLKNKYKK